MSNVIIIGAGIAGLSAGCYLQMNGYDTEIFEVHNKPGGLCTAWDRKNYIFDGCLHSLAGLNPKFKLHRYWKEVIDVDQLKFHYHDVLGTVENENGKIATIYTNPDKLKAELLSIAPQDKKFINSFIASIKKMGNFDFTLAKPIELWSPLDYYLSQFRTAPVLYHLMKWRKSVEDVSRGCKSEKLKRILNTDFYSRYPAYFLLISVGNLYNRNAGYPIGGSLPFAQLLEKKYIALKGKINYGSMVTQINTSNGCATGITLQSGKTCDDADYVISAADGYYTIFQMLEGKYMNDKIQKLYSVHPKWPSMVMVSLGIGRTFESEPSSIELHLGEEFTVDEQSKLNSVPITIYNFDPTLAPDGKTCMRIMLKTDNFKYWNNLRNNNPQTYQKEKDRVSSEIIKILDKRFGNIANSIEAIDVATPATFYRYTNNWMGSIQGWNWVPALIPETIPKVLPGLKNFYMIGQWTMPGGGVSTAFLCGRDITRIICNRDKKTFSVKSKQADNM